MRVALKIDVSSLSGARDGTPALLRLFDTYRVQASFAFAPGARWPGGLAGFRSGTGMDRRSADQLRAALAAGHELGLAAPVPRSWERHAARANHAWTRRQFRVGLDRWTAAIDRTPAFGAAPGWQLNAHLLTLEDERHWDWCSDTRGRYPFLPLLQGVRAHCVQIPTTLPTVDEVIASGAATLNNVHEFLYAESRQLRPAGHVFSADAERAGLYWLSTLEKLIVMWKGQGGSLRPLGQVYAELACDQLPRHQVGWGRVPGRKGYVAMQSVQVPR